MEEYPKRFYVELRQNITEALDLYIIKDLANIVFEFLEEKIQYDVSGKLKNWVGEYTYGSTLGGWTTTLFLHPRCGHILEIHEFERRDREGPPIEISKVICAQDRQSRIHSKSFPRIGHSTEFRLRFPCTYSHGTMEFWDEDDFYRFYHFEPCSLDLISNYLEHCELNNARAIWKYCSQFPFLFVCHIGSYGEFWILVSNVPDIWKKIEKEMNQVFEIVDSQQ